MSLRLRLVGVALALLLPGQLLGVWLFADGPPMQVPPSAIPSHMGPWSGGADEPLDPRVLEMLEPSSYAARTYSARGRPSIGLYVSFYAGRAGYARSPHDPEVCYPAAGWETVATTSVEVPVPGGNSLRAQLFDAQLGAQRQLVLYWFQPVARWPQGVVVEELRILLDAVAGHPQYAFVRLVAGVPEVGLRSAVLGDLIAFASELAWPVRAAVSGEQPPTAGAQPPHQAATATCSGRASA
jgi:EpsI family protein